MSEVAIVGATKNWARQWGRSWNAFWFTPRLPETLGLLRVVTGVMLLYSHVVLATDLTSFLGDQAWINNETAQQLHDGSLAPATLGRSYLWYLDSPAAVWTHHIVTILVTAAFAIGLGTRVTAPAAWFLQLMLLHRLTGALFGFDQIVTYVAMYLMISPCGSCYSVDSWLRRRWTPHADSPKSKWRDWWFPKAEPTVSSTVATRLLQLHLCAIYLFGGLAKARGEMWWDGTAVWFAVGNYEYQSLDMTFLAAYPRLFSMLSHVTLFWEIFYCALVWPRLTRPLVLALAVAAHGGIALFLGMITFGFMMIAANMIFIDPATIRRLLSRFATGESAPPSDLPSTPAAAEARAAKAAARR